jgi:hypothetical protein
MAVCITRVSSGSIDLDGSRFAITVRKDVDALDVALLSR